MKIVLAAIGKTQQPFVREGLAFYAERLKRYAKVELLELPDAKKSAPTPKLQKEQEAAQLLKAIPPTATVVALDEHGASFGSEAFADFLQKRMNAGGKELVFAVGGPYGHGPALLERAQSRLSLSSMTFPHDLVRLVFFEQLYRAFTILKNEPYHHG